MMTVDFLARDPEATRDAVYFWTITPIIPRDDCTNWSSASVCVVAVPGKTSPRLMGGLLVSMVILNLLFLSAEDGIHTNRRGRMNLHWDTRGIPGRSTHTHTH